MIKVKDLNTGEIYNVNPKKLVPSPRKHNKFSVEFIRATIYLHQLFFNVSPSPLMKWFEDFDRDSNPEKELHIWLYIAEIYKALTQDHPDDTNINKQIFTILVKISTGMKPKEIIKSQEFRNYTITKEKVERIYYMYLKKCCKNCKWEHDYKNCPNEYKDGMQKHKDGTLKCVVCTYYKSNSS
jgi:hypothetical protein